ncbi:hypothetical protein CYMTET_31624 [Cymbomonas tetramitiformis]|uniref:Transcription factor MYC/MYB N-terminal domain-containing protein n=1 Tax=Cymbomonas tetramitiformis TaxID=36881 RepID=A0AAE0FGP4_9CHLO|nr:hypothetical protein CYMTET_31624 [Cymbomonas tetramitiformis]
MTIAASEGLGLGRSKVRMLQTERQNEQRRSLDRGETNPDEAYVFPVGVGMPGRVVQTGKHEWITNVQEEDEGDFLRKKVAIESGIKTVFCVSLGGGDVVEFGSKNALPEDYATIEVARGTKKHDMTGHPLMR